MAVLPCAIYLSTIVAAEAAVPADTLGLAATEQDQAPQTVIAAAAVVEAAAEALPAIMLLAAAVAALGYLVQGLLALAALPPLPEVGADLMEFLAVPVLAAHMAAAAVDVAPVVERHLGLAQAALFASSGLVALAAHLHSLQLT